MTKYVFEGLYQTWASLPDGEVLTADPGHVYDLDFPKDQLGPLWDDDAAKVAAAEEAVSKAEPQPPAPTGTTMVNPIVADAEEAQPAPEQPVATPTPTPEG